MNISTGAPHILLFERDQQFVNLLSHELQQVGYECRTARTAVEVFDAIARYPIRLVLVNLAQAAAARREFWVALDTQRRGRGVQVFTFHCTNIGGYGPAHEDAEERSQGVLADMEVDGMLGIMNMVNAIRSRLVVSHSSTLSRSTAPSTTNSSTLGQATAPIAAVSASTISQGEKSSSSPSQPALPAATTGGRTPTPPANPTDKIRAVIYPNQRSWNTVREHSSGNGQASPVLKEQPEAAWLARNGQQRSANQAASSYAPPPVEPEANSQIKRPFNDGPLSAESGLAQLSRMLDEHRSPTLDELAEELGSPPYDPLRDDTALQQRVRPQDALPPISAMPLRASPIQDMPIERGAAEQPSTPSASGMKRADETHPYAAQAAPSLMSIATPTPVLTVPPAPVKTPSVTATATPTVEEVIDQIFVEAPDTPTSFAPAASELPIEDEQESEDDDTFIEDMQAITSSYTALTEPTQRVPDNAMLLDIVQSLPPMASPPPSPPQAQVLHGRATRSLGSVLLEGHLVSQNRLEVAQSIQRMLRGVDMHYQLGEILLMFKLLTPDQLLAASLVSYGLITTTQISALGRIRQELHAIGLEYDLENLLILFRMLTSEQLREVRTNWSA